MLLRCAISGPDMLEYGLGLGCLSSAPDGFMSMRAHTSTASVVLVWQHSSCLVCSYQKHCSSTSWPQLLSAFGDSTQEPKKQDHHFTGDALNPEPYRLLSATSSNWHAPRTQLSLTGIHPRALKLGNSAMLQNSELNTPYEL